MKLHERNKVDIVGELPTGYACNYENAYTYLNYTYERPYELMKANSIWKHQLKYVVQSAI